MSKTARARKFVGKVIIDNMGFYLRVLDVAVVGLSDKGKTVLGASAEPMQIEAKGVLAFRVSVVDKATGVDSHDSYLGRGLWQKVNSRVRYKIVS